MLLRLYCCGYIYAGWIWLIVKSSTKDVIVLGKGGISRFISKTIQIGIVSQPHS